MRITIWTLALAPWLLGHALCSEIASVVQGNAVEAEDPPPPLQVFEVQQTLLTMAATDNATTPRGEPDTLRHLAEKKLLLQRMSRSHGRWNEHHPRQRLLEALRGFSAYSQTQLAELDRLRGLYGRVSKRQRALLEREIGYSQKFTSVAALIARNQGLCDAIVAHALNFYRIDRAELDQHVSEASASGRPVDKTSVSQALKHLVRDWSSEGSHERDAAFPCLVETLQSLPRGDDKDHPTKVLLPGAGLGRLGHEVSRLPGGFEVTNNEWSAYQNVVYRFLEAAAGGTNSATHHPFLDGWSHHRTTANMLRAIAFPDMAVNARGVVLVEGDFTTAFPGNADAGRFDVVVTHFFIDTARNLMSYLDTIHRLLKSGGYWVNFGPLLYGTAPFVQLSLDEIVAVARAMGFKFLEVAPGGQCGTGGEVSGVSAGYGFDREAMTRNAYDAQFWVAHKV